MAAKSEGECKDKRTVIHTLTFIQREAVSSSI